MMKDNKSSMQGLIIGVIFFSLVFAAACACVVIFFPSELSNYEVASLVEADVDTIDTIDVIDVIDEEISLYPQSIIPATAERVVFANVEMFSQEDIASQARMSFNKQDSGLSLYREPQSRGMVEWFYSYLTGDRDVAMAILKNAENYAIPLSLAFALAYTESHYNVDAVHENTNSSIDRGLFQLNNQSFPELSEQQFYDPYVSAKYGLSHLRFCLNTAGNEITALAMYNAGSAKVKRNNTPQTTLNYISQIENYRSAIERAFESEVAALCTEELYNPKEELLALR